MRLSRPWVEDLRLPAGSAGMVWLPEPDRPPSRIIYHHRHVELEANLVLSGSGTYLIGDATCHLEPGSLAWLFPGQDHCLVQRSEDFSFIIAVWRPAVAAAAAADLGDARLASADPGPLCRRLGLQRMREDAELLAALGRAPEPEREAGLAYALRRLWRHGGEAPATAADGMPAAVARAARLLADPEAGRAVSIASLARGAGLSTDHLARLFRRHIGEAPLSYRNRCCLDRFLDRWRPGCAAMELAIACGFGSYSAFNRAFRAQLGSSPRSWIAARGSQRRDSSS